MAALLLGMPSPVPGAAAADPAALTPDSGPVAGGTEVAFPAPNGVTFSGLWLGTLHTLALGSDGQAYAWGSNGSGQLGTGKAGGSRVPVRVALPAGVTLTQLDAGGEFSVGLASNGSVFTWGANTEGQLGNGTREGSAVPVRVELPAGVAATSVVAGEYHVLALGDDGGVYGWGKDDSSQLGDGGTGFGTRRLTPVRAHSPEGVTFAHLSAGSYHSLALTAEGIAYAWGDNMHGQLGNGTTDGSLAPTAVRMPDGATFTELHAGGHYSVAVASDGGLFSWGANNHGQLGTGSAEGYLPVPTRVAAPEGVEFVTVVPGGTRSDPDTDRAGAGGYHTLALTTEGEALAWGRNVEGQLGDGSHSDSAIPIAVRLPAGVQVAELAAGTFHSAALTERGTAFGWGMNVSGQVGDGTAGPASLFVLEPSPVAMGVTVTGVTFDGDHGTALAERGNNAWQVVTPAHAAGTVDVVVAWEQFGIQRAPVSYPGGYTYVAPASLTIGGTKIVAPVEHGAPGLGEVSAEAWDVTVTAESGETAVISGDEAVTLETGTVYTVGERGNGGSAGLADAAASTDNYARKGEISCVDAAGGALPATVFDPVAGTILIAEDAAESVNAPLSCEITNQAAHVSFVTKHGDGATVAPSSDWLLTLEAEREPGSGAGPESAARTVALAGDATTVAARPGSYALSARAPSGSAVRGIERLRTGETECARHANSPEQAPRFCWEGVGAGENAVETITVAQGRHEVFRVLSTSPGQPIQLPQTGASVAWSWVAGGAGLLVLGLGVLGARAGQRKVWVRR